jgi:hypothetical protein
MLNFKNLYKLFISKFSFIIKWASYFYIFNKGLKIVIVLFRFFSYLLSGSFIAAFMVLYDFTAEVNDIWNWLISIKDYFLRVIINIYSKLISKTDIESPNTKVSENKPKGKSIFSSKSILLEENSNNSEPEKSLRNDNGYKHYKPEVSNTDTTSLHKDWRVWVGGALVLLCGLGLVYYYYQFGFNFGSNPDPDSLSDVSSDNHAQNTPFGPTIGPEAAASPTGTEAPASPVVTDPNVTPKAPVNPLPPAEPDTWGWGNPLPTRRLSKMERDYNKYFKEIE